MDVRGDGVSKVVGPATLLAPVSVEAASGTCLVLRGPNGSGISAATGVPTKVVRGDWYPA